MKTRWLALAAAAASTLVVAFSLPGTARATNVAATAGTLTMTSDAGDWVGQGASYAYSTPGATFWTHGDALYFDGNMARIRIDAGSDWWDLNFQAPTGQTLTAGVTYANAIRGIQSAPPPGAQPRLDVFGNGRGCNTLTGSFTVLDVTYGPYGYLQRFHATFEQHCEGATAALRGEIDVTAPAAPPAQAVSLTIDPKGGVSHRTTSAVVHGTISCAVPFTAYLTVSVSEQTKKSTITGTAWSVQVSCGGSTPTAWTATVPSDTSASFAGGTATVQASTSAFDDYYTQYLGQNPVFVNASQTSAVQLQLTR